MPGKLGTLGRITLLILLTGCPTRPTSPPSGTREIAPPAPLHVGRPYDIVAAQSLLTVLVYRAGPLARAGHNHVIASHELTGTVYVSGDPARSSCELHVLVGSFTVDEPELRARERSESDFPPQVPLSARDGTRANMLGEAVLDAMHYPVVDITCLQLETGTTTAARVRLVVRGRATLLMVPLKYSPGPLELTVDGELTLKQTELGLTPFTALLGALQVQDEMRVRFHLVARAAPTATRARPLLRLQLAQDRPRVVDLAQRLEDDRRVHGDGTVIRRIEPVGAGDRVDVAIEHESDDVAVRVDERAAGVAPDDIVAGR
jgi:hypothetical protein